MTDLENLENLKKELKKASLLLENGREGVAVADKGVILFGNIRIANMMGFETIDEILGLQVMDFVPPEYKKDVIDKMRANHDKPYDSGLLDKDGNMMPVSIWGKEIEYEGKQLRLTSIIDITERVKITKLREKLENQIQYTQKLESLGILAGGIAHDFNNLLVGILGNISLLSYKIGNSDDEINEYLSEIENTARRASDLTKQMLTYSGKGVKKNELVDLNEIILNMKQLLRMSVSKNHSIIYNLHDNLPQIKVDQVQIQQIVLNLVINSSEAMESNNGNVIVSTGIIYADKEYLMDFRSNNKLDEKKYVILEVSDRGYGIKEDDLDKIFDPFFSTKFTGRGLGLSVVQGIVNSYDGGIRVYSEKNKGTTFKILFPSRTNGEQQYHIENGTTNTQESSMNVLICDDEKTVRDVLKKMLTTLTFNVYTAVDGRDALNLFNRVGLSFDLIIMDITMPELDGYEAFKKIRKKNKEIPIILSSGFNSVDIENKFLGKKLDAFISKPYTFEELKQTIERVMKHI